MIDLWELVFEGLQGYLFTFTGRQSGFKENDLVLTDNKPWKWPEEKLEAAAYLEQESEAGRDAYFCTHLLRTSASRQGSNAAPQILTLWVDGDGAQVPKDWPQPTAVVESSPGRHHYYWRLTHPVTPEEASQLNRRLAYGMGGDKGKWGLGTVLRPPGTFNYKRATPTLVTAVIYV